MDDDRLRGMPRDLMQDIKRAAYEAKVREMEDQARMQSCPGCGAPAGYPPAGPCRDHGTPSAVTA